MNYWTRLSIDLAINGNYLDRLFSVYDVELDFTQREITNEYLDEVRERHDNHDYNGLILKLLESAKFPIDYTYVGFLKRHRDAMANNPETINRIGGYLVDRMSYDDIVSLLRAPKKSSRKIGPMFQKWVKNGGLGEGFQIYDYEHKDIFLRSNNGILCASDKKLKEFCIINFGLRRTDKGVDFVAKINNNVVIGEAKFISAKGGTQDKSFKDIKSLLNRNNWNHTQYHVIPIGILDGIPYFQDGHYQEDLNHDDWNILSVLYLRDFLRDL